MTLEKKLKKKSAKAPDPYGEGHVRLIKLSDALAICEEALEKQKLACLKNLINPPSKHEMTTGQPRFRISMLEIRDLILNAPKPTWEDE